MSEKINEIREKIHKYRTAESFGDSHYEMWDLAYAVIEDTECMLAEIDRLNGENAELKRENASWGDYIADKDKQLDFADAENKKLKQQLAEANERLGAAVEDIKRGARYNTGMCGLCMRKPDPYFDNMCKHAVDGYACWEWRGLQGKDEK